MSRRAVHVIDVAQALYIATLTNRTSRMLCGKPLYFQANEHHKARETTVAIYTVAARDGAKKRGTRTMGEVNGALGAKNCKQCFFLARLTPAERAAEIAKRTDKTKAAFDKLKSKKAEANRIKNEARAAKIEAARGDALVCLDAFVNSDGKHYPERCKTWLRTEHPTRAGESATQIRCNLVRGHDGDCKERTWEDLALDMREVLDIAIDAHKFANKSGGYRLVVIRDGARACRYCSGELSEGDTCDGCSRPLPKPARATPRDVCCRFCSAVLGRDQSPFEDYSHAAFDLDGSRLQTIPQYANATEMVDVWKHTVVCALSYLAGVVRTEQTDEPIAILPASSFVLEHDTP